MPKLRFYCVGTRIKLDFIYELKLLFQRSLNVLSWKN